ncbi:preprotein translocase subunit YajC [Microbacterium sp. Marseille-Q6965]|uniref:preprotein translocase subunit YajC n=1 Tax=Microbacterium sp. Marseille-Q6965 TaxID=2965072 RepID=UPI0021B7B474|nr:preprotein translocase subunit YajC [Microbacterium sp. Marseille-Q6965]
MDMNLILLVVLAVMVVFMFVSSRRNAKKRQELEEQRRTQMVPGARVMTRSGLFGTLVAFDAEDLTQPAKVEIAPGVIAEVHAQAVDLVPETETTEPAATDVADDAAEDEGYTLNGERIEKPRGDDDTK